MNFKGSFSFSFVLAEKLKALKGILKIWNKDVFGKVKVKKSDALSRINHWDVKEKDNLLTLEETEERNLAREDYKYWSLLEEALWRQKYRGRLLKEGDRNTCFFFIKWLTLIGEETLLRKSKSMEFVLKRKQPLGGRWRVPIRTSFRILVVSARVYRARALRKLEEMWLPNWKTLSLWKRFLQRY